MAARPVSSPSNTSATCSAIITAPKGKYPLVIALAVHIRSGCTPQWRLPVQLPVRPKAVITSSAISRMPFFEQISRTPGMKLSCGGITPPAPRIGSMIIAAMVPAP